MIGDTNRKTKLCTGFVSVMMMLFTDSDILHMLAIIAWHIESACCSSCVDINWQFASGYVCLKQYYFCTKDMANFLIYMVACAHSI